MYRHENKISKVVDSPADTMSGLNGLATVSSMYRPKAVSMATHGRLGNYLESTLAFRDL